MKLLTELKKTILDEIYNDCLNKDFIDETTLIGEIEIIYNKEVVGYVSYKVLIEATSPCFNGDWDTPPHEGDYDFILDSVFVHSMYSTNGFPLSNITKALNELMEKCNTIIN